VGLLPIKGKPVQIWRICALEGGLSDFGLFGAARRPSPQVRGHLPVTADGSSTVGWLHTP